jgi:two-component system chemotaxis response regulator CheY
MDALRALVVDDSPSLRAAVATALLRIPRLACVEAADGAEGLRRFHEGRFDLVFTDIQMPVLDGLKLIHHLRTGAGAAGARVPIVVVSTLASAADRERALALGASAYLVKPVAGRDVVDTARALLGLR